MPHAMTEDHAHDDADVASRRAAPLMTAPTPSGAANAELRLVEPPDERAGGDGETAAPKSAELKRTK